MSQTITASFPLVNTAGRFAIRLEPDADGNGTGFTFGFQTSAGEIFRCHSTGTQEGPLAVVKHLRQVVDDLERQVIERGSGR